MECPFCKQEVEEGKLKNYQGARMCISCLAKSLESKHFAARSVTTSCGGSCDHDHDAGGCGDHDHDVGGCGGHGHGDGGGGGCCGH